MATTKTLFQTEGILQDNNFSDVPNKPLAMTNLLTSAFGGETFTYDDIAIVNGINSYGSEEVNYQSFREENRLYGIEQRDINKVKGDDGRFKLAEPLQTIANRLSSISVQLGENLMESGGTGLLAEYYNWSDVYGITETDLISKGGGSYVIGQDAALTIPYFSPNTAIAPSDAESFYNFSSAELVDIPSVAKEIGWEQGLFDYGDGAFHPAVNDNNTGIVKFSGYFNPGFSIGGQQGLGVERTKRGFTTDRLIITAASNRFDPQEIFAAQTTMPTIVKVWDVDQTTGQRLTSDLSPLTTARYAPGLESPTIGYLPLFGSIEVLPSSVNTGTDVITIANHGLRKADILSYSSSDTVISPLEDGESYFVIKVDNNSIKLALDESNANSGVQIDLTAQGTGLHTFEKSSTTEKYIAFNSPMYVFEGGLAAAGINDQYTSPNFFDGITDRKEIGHNYVIAPITDSSPNNKGQFDFKGTRASNKYINPFKNNHFYSIEAFFIMAPRVAQGLIGKYAFFQSYDKFNTRGGILDARYFHPANPLNKPRGKIQKVIDQSIPRHGSYVSGKTYRLGKNAANNESPDFSLHENSFGTNSPNKYGRLLSDTKITITYKPPHSWSQIARLKWESNGFRRQSESPVKQHYVAWGFDSTKTSWENNETTQPGNLIYDYNSPKPRNTILRGNKGGTNDGSIFQPFTYISHMDYQPNYVELNKPVTGEKVQGNPIVQAVDHRGLKGYGVGRIELANGMGPGGGVGSHLVCGLDYDQPRMFYEGEQIGKGDIIIFENYNNTPFLSVFDASPKGAFVSQISSVGAGGSAGRVEKVNNTLPGKDNAALQAAGLRPGHGSNDTPEGRTFFVYRHRGLVDESLDGFCSLYKTGTPTIQALVKHEALTGHTKVRIDRKELKSYDGQFYREAYNINDQKGPTGVMGLRGMGLDYNGTAAPSDKIIINKVLDLQMPATITIDSATYHLDQYGHVARGREHAYLGQAIYGAPVAGDYFYRKDGTDNSPTRLIYDNSANQWELTDGSSTLATYAGGTKFTFPTSLGTGTTEITRIDTNSPDAPIELHLTDSTDGYIGPTASHSTNDPSTYGYADEPLIQDLKIGFGLTICDSPSRATTRYQCFPPTDTAPPFRATSTGLRSVPEGKGGVAADSVGSVVVSHASPGADGTTKPITSITCSQIKIEGSYGNNSPGYNNVPVSSSTGNVKSFIHDGNGNFFQPGGVILLESSHIAKYTKTLEIEFLTSGTGDTQKYHLLGTLDSSAT